MIFSQFPRSSRFWWMFLVVFVAISLTSGGVWLWDQRASLSSVANGQEASEQNPDGHSEQDQEHAHTNLLIHESSPYLLQHAHNPVNWHPWSEEAFEKAKREGKPIFLSIGYSTCYWCHVMEVESFEDAEVAAIINEHFIAIKVDREERPDIDEQYMLATQLLTQRGGWPNSVWLTPEGKPWMAGTYFPKPQFMQTLRALAELWRERRDDVERQADRVAQAAEQLSSPAILKSGELTPQLVEQAVAELIARFDPRYGGFGAAPKFPPHGTLQLLIRQYRDTADESLRVPITKTLDAMWLGGMHDHIGGGFHRYATDNRWLLPHFEKMLYDNAQLMRLYADAYAVTGHERYREAVADIYGWVQRDMTSPDGAFYSAIDSGEVGKEGEAYVWRVAELQDVLSPADAALFAELYNFESQGNFTEESTGERPGTNIPHLDQPIRAIAEQRGEDPNEFEQRLAQMREQLLTRRQMRPQPHKDDKVLSGWNGLMIGSLAHAGHRLDEPRYVEAAERAADFILDKMVRDGMLLRTYRGGDAKLPGFLDDYVYLAQGLIELHRATNDTRWLDQADRLAATLVDEFQDKENGGFYFTTPAHEELIVRSKHLGGGGNVPNPNGVAAQVLLQIAELTDQPAYTEAAKRTLESLAGLMAQRPYSSEELLLATTEYLENSASPTATTEEDDPTASQADTSTADRTRRIDPVTVGVYASRLSTPPGGSLELAVAIDIDDGWHLYAPNPGTDFLVPTTVAVDSADPFVAGDPEPPAPHQMMDPILKKTLNTYTGRIWFRVPVSVDQDAEAGESALTVRMKIQACDDERCLPPQTTELRIPLQIDPEASSDVRHPAVFAVPGDEALRDGQ